MRFFSDNLEVTDSLGNTYVFASRGNAVGLQLLGEANSVSQYDLPQLLDRLPTYSFNELLQFWRNQSPLPYALCDSQAERQLVEAVKSGDLCIFQVTDGLEATLSSATAANTVTSAATPAAAGAPPRQQTQQSSAAPEQPVAARPAESEAEVVQGNEAGTLEELTETDGVVRVSSRPEWLRRLDAGNDFNEAQAPNYPYKEVYINKPDGGKSYYRLDSYDPESREIVSRKFTQLSEIQNQTALNYITEIPKKYPVGATIAKVESSGSLADQQLQGSLILEVPVQQNPIPQSIIDAADKAGVLIRDIDGRIY
ncbi:hypothetical protein [Gallaecimonas pentaromativorans]|uniref:hypothetical protein n=1 Tax=Gallaecimonas pentaromativorans TaxID=584787 RepID=UPI003A8D1AB9